MSTKKTKTKQIETSLFVAKGASVITLDRRHTFLEGQEVTVDDQATSKDSRKAITPGQAERLKRIGFLVETEKEVREATAPAGVPEVPALPTAAPGKDVDVDASPAKTANVQQNDVESRAQEAAKAAKEKALASAKVEKTKAGAKGNQKAASIWNLDPARLKGQSLASLNAIVKDKDPSMEPFTTEDEAIAQLSLDFTAK